MKQQIIYLLFPVIISSCVVPVNLHYETAELLKPGEVQFTGSASVPYAYPYPASAADSTFFQFSDLSFGARLSIGTGEKTNLSLRYESTKITDDVRQSFGEIQLKFSLGSDLKFVTDSRKASVGIPIQFYTYTGYSAIAFNPRWYFTFWYDNPRFDFTVIPKLHFILPLEKDPFPGGSAGITINCTLSSNKQKWAFRPEIGNLGRTLGFGVSFMVRL